MNTYIRNMIIILSMIGGYSILFVENTFAQRIWSPQRQSEEPVSIDAYKSVDEDFYLQLKVEFTNEEDKKIEYIMKNVEGKDYLQYEWIDLDKIEEYLLLPKAIKDVLKENKFPIHKINNDLK